jgi:hypothetical protein
MQIHLQNRLMHLTHERNGLRRIGGGARKTFVVRPASVFSAPNSSSRKCAKRPPVVLFRQGIRPKKHAVTWCYIPAQDITFFASTLPGPPHKLLLKGHWDVQFVEQPARPHWPRSTQVPLVIARYVCLAEAAFQGGASGRVSDGECRVFSNEILVLGRGHRGRGFVRPCKPDVDGACRRIVARIQRDADSHRVARRRVRRRLATHAARGATCRHPTCRRPVCRRDHTGQHRYAGGAASAVQSADPAHRLDSRRRRALQRRACVAPDCAPASR